MSQGPAQSVGFFLIPGFAMTSFSLAIEALTATNRVSAQQLYRYIACSPAATELGGQVRSSSGLWVQTTANYVDGVDCDILIVCSYEGAAGYKDASFEKELRKAAANGKTVIGISCGAFLLARAGLLDGQTCTLVPDYRAVFSELYPAVTIQDSIFTVNRNILTSAGGTSTLDMMLFLIGQHQGADLIRLVARQFMQDRVRTHEQIDVSQRHLGLRIKSLVLGSAVEVMERHIEEPLSIAALAGRVGTTPRNLAVVFKKHVGMTPGRYYLEMRLRMAKDMLNQTDLSLANIALATGFKTQSHFSRSFRSKYHVSASDWRKQH
ncbi:MAG: GlxA family transcriptional regulator [Litorivicinus sp.]